jgi:adenylosuccinate synthase
VKVCTGYRVRGKAVEDMPATNIDMDAIEPVYETLPGWKGITRSLTDGTKLPVQARDYLSFIEEKTGVEIGCISTGPERNETILRPASKLAGLLG